MSAPHPSLEPALAALERGDWSSAKAATLAYLGAQPRSGEGFLVLASALHRMDELDRALLALGQALTLDANQSAGYFLLGVVLEALDQPGYAERAFATALRLDPEHPTAMQRRLACRARKDAPSLPEADARAIERLLDAVRPTVSACLIVKNEEKTLARCLESLKGWVDEIVVVDTGSTDGTVAIAESFGAQVGHFSWVDDFSAARNASLELATSEWVLVIDADETLDVVDSEEWTAWLRRRTFGGYAIYQANLHDDGTLDNETPVMRLFQRLPGVRFAGRLHESVGPALESQGLVIVNGPFAKLHHTGYQTDALAERQKGQRNLALARKTAEERPDDVVALYQLGRSHMLADQPAEALPVFDRLADMPGVEALPRTMWATFVTIYGNLLVGASRPGEAIALYDRALAQLPDFPEFLFERGKVLAAQGRLEEARADFMRCSAMAGRAFSLTMRHGITDALPREALAQLDAAAPSARPTVSACLIVKNEEKNLARCLESLKGWVDEIVVVDTGSTDDTVAIAESFGAKVGHFTWVNDFSAARNASLALATSDWALVVDADETLVLDSPERWVEALRRRDFGGYVITVRNLRDDGTAENDAPVLRLFQRHGAIRFAGRLHESTGTSIEALGLPIGELLEVRLLHTGYQQSTMTERQKGARNMAIALEAAQEQPDDLFAQLQLARSYCFDHRPAEALPVLDRLATLPALHALPLSPWANYVTIHADVLRHAGRLEDAEALLTRALERLPDFPEFLFDRGIARAVLGRQAEARADFERCLALAGRTFNLSVRDGVTGALPRQALAEMDAAAEAHAGRPRVSACLIVKNEAQRLAACLASLRGFVDEIVVVDTGSTDDTVAIAESFGAQVGHFTWTDDFSAARNASLELATSEWVLVIDADETLEAQPAHWRQVLEGPCEGVVLTQANLDDTGRVASETQALRLFKRDARVRYAGRLHESVAADATRLGWRLGVAPFLRLRHSGYQRARVEGADKGGRNVRIAEAAVAERPDAPDAWLDLARSHALDRNPTAALAAFERLDALPGGMGALDERAWIYAVQARQAAYQDLGRAPDAEALLDRALTQLPGFPEFHAERAALRLRRGDRPGAVADYRACLAAHGRTFSVPVRPGLTDAVPTAALAGISPTVSACLIVKNEAQRLAACLESLKGWVDEIVVVDTGSTDDTVAIAESFGAKLGHFTWVNDFSAARNASLALATCEWVLIIDADEQLRVEDPDAWRRALDATDRSYLMEIVNVDDRGHVASRTFSFPRLFRRHPEARFEGRLHETPGFALGALGWPMTPIGCAWLRHEGYTDAMIASGDKLARNRGLAEQMIRDNPLDPDAWHYLANTHWLAKDAAATLDALAGLARVEAAGYPLPLNHKRTAILVETWALTAEGRFAEALAVIEAGLSLAPGYVEYMHERGRLRARLGDDEGAISDFLACLAVPRGSVAAREGLTGYASHTELVEVYARRGQLDRAAEHMRAAAADPACPTAEAAELRAVADRLAPIAPPVAPVPPVDRLEAATDALVAENWPAAKAHALAHLEAHPRSVDGFMAIALTFYRLGELNKSLLALGQALTLDANQSAGYFLLGVVLEALDQPGYAERAFATALRLDPEHPTAMQRRLACRARKDAPSLPEADAQAIERLLDAVRPTVSACLIVKNEEKTLARCLESLKGWVDEIVVVDTGSTDGTVAIAESFGAQVGHFTWTDDFSAARNASLELATSEWVLVIDADETLDVVDPEAWTQAMRRRTFGGYVVTQRNAQAGGAVLDNPLMRLFQRHPGIRYNGRLHEDVTRAIAALGWPITDMPGLRLDHDGYMPEQAAAKDKWNRNFQLALAEVESRPDDAGAWYNLGRSALHLGQADGSLAAFAQAKRLLDAGAEFAESRLGTFVTLYQRLLVEQGRTDEALALLNDGITRMGPFPEFCYERGLLRAQLGDVAGAREDFAACLRPSERVYLGAMRAGITDALPRRAIADLDARPTAR